MDAQQFKEFMEFQTAMISTLFSQLQSSQSQTNRESSSKGEIVMNTALLANFENFDSKKESFSNYKSRFQNYLQMKQINTNKPYCAQLLLNSIGAQNFNMITALAAPKTPDQLTYDELIKLLEEHLAPKKNVLVAQHHFLSIYQNEQQSIPEFVSTLKSNISDCEFTCECKKSVAEIFLTAQFIRGLYDNSIREQLLQSDSKTFKDIFTRAIALESSKIDARKIAQKTISTSSSTVDINKVNCSHQHVHKMHRNHSRSYIPSRNRKSRYNRPLSRKYNLESLGLQNVCLRCGKSNHITKDCHTEQTSLKCTLCNRTGHVSKVCITSLVANKTKSESANQIQNDDSYEIARQYGVQHIVDIHQNHNSSDTDMNRYYAHVKIEGKPIKFEVDSGSAYTFLQRQQLQDLNLNIPLEPATIAFRSYTQDFFIPDGKIVVDVSYGNIKIKEDVYIVPDDYAVILGRVWIRRLKIDLNQLSQQNTSVPFERFNLWSVEEVSAKYPNVFEEKIGCVPGFNVVLKLCEGVQPCFHREREIPYALSTLVEKELDPLENAGIITKISISDWGSPLVVIPKADGGVRLAVDYKVGVNERLMNSHYPIRKIEDILNSLRNSRFFCRLDLYKAYLHIKVDEKSSEIQTISTHRGTYRMNRLSFEMKTTPSEFNRIMDQSTRLKF
nr:uncharacterized protein K02A2.6-like [Leptinotarsa decemlineata]